MENVLPKPYIPKLSYLDGGIINGFYCLLLAKLYIRFKKHYVYCLLQFAKIDIILNLKNVLDITK